MLENRKTIPYPTEVEQQIMDDDMSTYYDDYVVNSYSDDLTFVEFAIINSFLYESYRTKSSVISVMNYGTSDNIGRLCYNGSFDVTSGFWFSAKLNDDDNDYIIQTLIFLDNRGELVTQLSVTAKNGLSNIIFEELLTKIKSLAFNNSQYKGKCIKVKFSNNNFRGIEVIDIEEASNELILNETQHKFIDHFVARVSRGANVRYLLNGEPGTGKTESIREIARKLIPDVTFVIPEFKTTDDLISIMEACEIFENGVIVMDDIDLFLGNRENGHYTSLLGQFLSFFDGVKKRKISLLASTNDKGLVDKAGQRPGRFNFILDYGFLNDEQIVKVCNIHLAKEWQIDEVYKSLMGTIDGSRAKITGAFIANLASNINEMSCDYEDWSLEDTLNLIKHSYKGFYASQVSIEKTNMGFKI